MWHVQSSEVKQQLEQQVLDLAEYKETSETGYWHQA